jgi:hypothetical protein
LSKAALPLAETRKLLQADTAVWKESNGNRMVSASLGFKKQRSEKKHTQTYGLVVLISILCTVLHAF